MEPHFPDSLAACLILFLPAYLVHSTRLWWPASRVTPPVPLPRVVLSTAKGNGAGLCTQEALQPCGVLLGCEALLSQISQSGGIQLVLSWLNLRSPKMLLQVHSIR